MHRRDMMLQRSVARYGLATILALGAAGLTACSSRDGYPDLNTVPTRPTAVDSLAQRARIAKELTAAEKVLARRAADPLAPAPAMPAATPDETVASVAPTKAENAAATAAAAAAAPRRLTERRSARDASLNDFLMGITDDESASGVVIDEGAADRIAPGVRP